MRLSFDFGLDRRIVAFACTNDRDDLPAWYRDESVVKVCRGRRSNNGIAHNGLGPADNVPDPCAYFVALNLRVIFEKYRLPAPSR